MAFSTVIAHLTDTHVVTADTDEPLFVDNNARLAAALSAVNVEDPAPDVLLMTGDLTNWGTDGEYAELTELLSVVSIPILAVPGNHDDRDRTRLAFPDLPWADAEHASWITTVGGVRVIGLDSTTPGEPGACFDDDRAEWLALALAEPSDGPTVLALHHPPFATGIGWMDASGFVGLKRLEALLSERPVDRVLCGHFHRPIQSSIAGIPAQVGPSTVQHVELDLAPHGEVKLINDPAAYQLHCFEGDRVVSHTRFFNTGEAAYVPGWAGSMAT